MTNITSSFSHYVTRAADILRIPADETTARSCVEFIFGIMLEEKDLQHLDPVEKYRRAIKNTTEWIGPRYEAYRLYAPDFFKNLPAYDHDATIVAMLCAGHMDKAHIFSNDDNPEIPTVFKNDSIRFDVVERANALIEEAEDIVKKITGQNGDFDGNEPGMPALFLAHGYIGDVLFLTDNNGYKDLTKKELGNIKHGLIAHVCSFVHSYTLLGQEVLRHAGAIESYIDDLLQSGPKAPAAQVNPPFLTLVRNI